MIFEIFDWEFGELRFGELRSARWDSASWGGAHKKHRRRRRTGGTFTLDFCLRYEGGGNQNPASG